jgi:hypothetical protein
MLLVQEVETEVELLLLLLSLVLSRTLLGCVMSRTGVERRRRRGRVSCVRRRMRCVRRSCANARMEEANVSTC